MPHLTLFVLAITWCVVGPVQAQSALMQTARGLFTPLPTQPPVLEGIPSTPERVELGKMLYFDPRLSESHALSCNSCHSVGLGGVDVIRASIGHRWQRGGRNAPTVLNAVFNTAQFWDGRAKDLEEQAGGPLVNLIEMGTNLTDTEIDKITAFLHTLTGEQPQVVYPTLLPRVASTPRPQL